MDQNIIDIYNMIQELAWLFGEHAFNGECCGDMSFVEYVALKKIRENDEITIQETGRALNFTKSGASKIIDRLENKGYVARQVSPLDGRVCCVSPTSKGAAATADIVHQYASYVNEMLQELDAATVSNIKASLQMLVDSARRHGNPHRPGFIG